MKTLCSIIIVSASLIIQSCGYSDKHEKITSSVSTMLDMQAGSCPFLTKDNKGNIVLSWVRMNNDSSSAFCYAVSKDGKTLGSPVVIPNSSKIQPHGENLPKIIFKPSGEIIALWGASNPAAKNKYAGLVSYTQSFDDGKTWTNPRALTNDTASFDQRYYDVSLLPDGEAAIIWLDNRKTSIKEGSALYFAKTDGKNGFQNERLISQQCCPCCRTDLFVDSKGGIHALYRGIIEDSIRDMVHIVSADGAKTFTVPQRINEDNWVINGCPHTGPTMTENNEGLHFAWYTGGNIAGSFYKLSSNGKNASEKAESISRRGSHPQMATLSNNDVVVVWDELVEGSDKPSKKIGVQQRDINGKKLLNKYITSDTSLSSYPVVAGINQASSFVAYTTRKADKNYIYYQVVGME